MAPYFNSFGLPSTSLVDMTQSHSLDRNTTFLTDFDRNTNFSMDFDRNTSLLGDRTQDISTTPDSSPMVSESLNLYTCMPAGFFPF
jgi:hypothetical protein